MSVAMAVVASRATKRSSWRCCRGMNSTATKVKPACCGLFDRAARSTGFTFVAVEFIPRQPAATRDDTVDRAMTHGLGAITPPRRRSRERHRGGLDPNAR